MVCDLPFELAFLSSKIVSILRPRDESFRDLFFEPLQRVVDDVRMDDSFLQASEELAFEFRASKPLVQTAFPRCACAEQPYRESARFRQRPETIVTLPPHSEHSSKPVNMYGDAAARPRPSRLRFLRPSGQRSPRQSGALSVKPGRRNSGESEPQKGISKEGDRYLRTIMVRGAHYILGPFGEDSDLRRWGLKLAERGGKNAKKRAVVAVARKLAVLLHRLWVSGEVYEPLRNSQKAMRAVA